MHGKKRWQIPEHLLLLAMEHKTLQGASYTKYPKKSVRILVRIGDLSNYR